MNRREAVKSVAFLIGGALSASTIATLFDGCTQPGSNKGNLFTPEHQKLVTEIADIIIPTTAKSPGAKAANVGPFITMMMEDCYPAEAQQAFVKGLDDLEANCNAQFSQSFLDISVKEREQLIAKLREETLALQKMEKEENEKAEKLKQDVQSANPALKKAGNPMEPKEKPKTKPLFFAIARDLTLLGYFTSEIGATKAYQFIEIPGRYDGCVDLKPGQRVYA